MTFVLRGGRGGVDSLVLGLHCRPDQALVDRALAVKREGGGQLMLGGSPWKVEASGSAAAMVILNSEHGRVEICRRLRNAPGLTVGLRAQALWRNGLAHCWRWAVELGRAATCGREDPRPMLKRLDLCCDVAEAGEVFGCASLGDFVTRAKKSNCYAQRLTEQEETGVQWRAGTRESMFSFGKGRFLIRCYDKTEEIKRQRPDKAWFFRPEVWDYPCDSERPVWRVEVQMRREFLSDFQRRGVCRKTGEVLPVDNLRGIQIMIPHLWSFAVGGRGAGAGWLELRRRSGVGERHRYLWPVDPAWEHVQAVRWPGFGGAVVEADKRRELKATVRAAQVRGHVQALQALLGTDAGEEGALEVMRWIYRQAERQGHDWPAAVADKALTLNNVPAGLN